MTAALTVVGASKRFGGRPVLQGVDLALAPGNCLVLAGGSGAGKTTLLRLIAGLARLDAGMIRIAGKVVDEPKQGRWQAPEARGLGMVFQDYALWPHLSALENVAAVLPSDKQRRQRAHAWLERLGVGSLAECRPQHLSGGQQQRVGIARALAREPRLLLLDEPLSNLDVDTRDQLRVLLRELIRNTGTAAVWVSHDPVDIWRMADQAAILEAGRLVQMDTPENLYRAPATMRVARFTGAVGGFIAPLISGPSGLGVVLDGHWVPVDVPAGLKSGMSVQCYTRPEAVRADTQGIPATRLHTAFEDGRWRTYWRLKQPAATLCSLDTRPLPDSACLTITQLWGYPLMEQESDD